MTRLRRLKKQLNTLIKESDSLEISWNNLDSVARDHFDKLQLKRLQLEGLIKREKKRKGKQHASYH